jgi:hypothetical protein
MSASVAFLTRLSLIAGGSAGDEASALHVAALVRAYEGALCAQLGITRSSRPAAGAKEIAIEALEELRREVLKAELRAAADAAAIFATARDRIDIARRALTLRVTADEPATGVSVGRRDDRQRLDAIKSDLRNRRLIIVTSLDAIAQSRELPGPR